MYCRECGKEIANDAKFCPYCGISLSGEKKEILVNIIFKKLQNTKLSTNNKLILAVYLMWIGLNIIINLTFGARYPTNSDAMAIWVYYRQFWPFDSLDPGTYDFTEFKVYVIGLPLILFGGLYIYKYIKNRY